MTQIVYGKFSETVMREVHYGRKGILFTNWGQLNITGDVVEFNTKTNYKEWVIEKGENLCLVEEGQGSIIYNNQEFEIKKGDAFKIFPGQEPVIVPQEILKIFSIQMPTQRQEFPGEDLNIIKVRRPKHIPEIVYEYEALGQEYFTPKYENGLGLIRFIFPIDNIPIHIHPNADRIIRPISGKGFTYAEPTRFEMDSDTFCLFPKGTRHTNGPLPGEVYDLWAVQLPWIESGVTEGSIGGREEFVTYVESVPPKPLWKTKEGLQSAVRKLRRE